MKKYLPIFILFAIAVLAFVFGAYKYMNLEYIASIYQTLSKWVFRRILFSQYLFSSQFIVFQPQLQRHRLLGFLYVLAYFLAEYWVGSYLHLVLALVQ